MTEVQRVAVILKRSLPPGMHSADGKAGIGISFGTDMEGYQIIQSLAPQGSAAMSGQVRAGDIIFLVNGNDVRGLPIKDVVDLIKGIPETTVELLMGRRVDAWMSSPTEQARPQDPQKIQEPPQPPPTVQAQPQLPPAPAPPPPAPPSPAVPEQPTSPLQTREVVVQPRTLSPSPAPKEYTPAPPDPPPRNETAPPLPREVTLPSPPSPPKPTPAAPPPASQAPPAPAAQPIQAPTPENKQNGFVVKNWPDGKQYRGEMLEGKRHGKGSIIYPDGASYEGDWHNDWRHGHGEYKYTDGTWYKGQWEMGNRQGEGLCTYADGNMFQGSWVANLPHGKGQCRFAEGSLYRGEFVMGKMHGTGTLIRHDGTIAFEGEWRDGEKVAPPPTPFPQPPSPPQQQPMQLKPMNSMPTVMRAAPSLQAQIVERTVKLYIMIKGVSHMPQSAQGAPSPYVVISHGSQSHITRTQQQTYNPRWESEIGEFHVRELNDLEPLLVRVFDWSPNKSDLMGEVELDVRDPTKFRVQQELSFNLMRSNGSFLWGQDGQQTQLYAAVSLNPPQYIPMPPLQEASVYIPMQRAVSPVMEYQPPATVPSYQATPPTSAPLRDYSQQMQSMRIAAEPVQTQPTRVAEPTYIRSERTFETYARSNVQSMPVAGNVGSGRCGVGLKLTQPSSKVNVTIDKIQKDSAADVSGRLKPGDVVVRVEGRSISDLEQAKELLIGQEGSQVAIEVARSEGGALRIFEVILTRKNLSIRRGDRGSLDPGNGYSSSTRDPKFQDARYYSSGGGGSSYDPWRDERGTSNANGGW